MTKTKKKLIVSPVETGNNNNNNNENRIVLSSVETIKKNGRIREITILSRVETIATSKNKINAYRYFLKKGCSFAKDIKKTLECSKATSYRIIDSLEENHLIFPIAPMKIGYSVPGPNPCLYGVEDVTQEEINKAVERYKKYNTKAYSYIEQVYQRTLPDVIDENIQYNKIIRYARQEGNNGFHIRFIADEVAKIHQSEGVNVWRRQ